VHAVVLERTLEPVHHADGVESLEPGIPPCYPPTWYIPLKLNEIDGLQRSTGVSLCRVVR
jgi:hypothetical protein